MAKNVSLFVFEILCDVGSFCLLIYCLLIYCPHRGVEVGPGSERSEDSRGGVGQEVLRGEESEG